MAIFDLPGKNVLMHNRAGLRIELNVHEFGLLNIWTSPQAGKSNDVHLRNFSNRDDNTSIFDQVKINGIKEETFVKCEWDPFYSKIIFTNQTIHILALYNKPAVVIWFEKHASVDIKTDKSDKALQRDLRTFSSEHPDRGHRFVFAATLGNGNGTFYHQLALDKGRSAYTRALLDPLQMLVIGGELDSEPVLDIMRSISLTDTDTLVHKNEEEINAALQYGTITLKNNDRLNSFIYTARRTLLAMTDMSGTIRASLARIYYLIWHRDGAVTHVFQANGGFREPLEQWTSFELENPTIISGEKPEGRTFLQLVGPITKWEEDGVFYAVLSAFSALTQGNSEKFSSKEIRLVLSDSIKWLEQYCFDSEKKMFGRYFRCEEPFIGSRDFGYDNAVGSVRIDKESKGVMFEGKQIVRSYDIYMNLIMYSVYCMMSTIDKENGLKWGEKAKELLKSMEPLFNKIPCSYGDLLTYEGEVLRAGPYGLDQEDYIWAQTVPPFTPFPDKLLPSRKALLEDAINGKRSNYFLASYFGMLQSCDPLWTGEDTIYKAILRGVEKSYETGSTLPMPNAMLEMLATEDGDPWHYIRPQGFSIGPFVATIAGLGVRRLPFGLAVRSSSVLDKIDKYQYKDSLIEFSYHGESEFVRVNVNGNELSHSLQIPEQLFVKGSNKVSVEPVTQKKTSPILVYSTICLNSISEDESTIYMNIEAYCSNQLHFKNVNEDNVSLLSGNIEIPLQWCRWEDIIIAQFEGNGNYKLKINKKR